MKWLRRIWWWLIRSKRVLMDGIYMPVSRMSQPYQGVRKAAGVRVAIRKACGKSRPPKPAKRRQRDIDKEQLARIKAKRVQVA